VIFEHRFVVKLQNKKYAKEFWLIEITPPDFAAKKAFPLRELAHAPPQRAILT
jgi:hypothetical protein